MADLPAGAHPCPTCQRPIWADGRAVRVLPAHQGGRAVNEADPLAELPPLRYILDEQLTHRPGCPQTAKLVYSDERIRCLQCDANAPGHVECLLCDGLADPEVAPDPQETP